MSLVIRKAHAEDASLILQFIKELAEYEKLSHEVSATAEDIRQSLFGHIPHAYAVIAEWEGEPAGFALYFYNFSTFLGQKGMYLEDLFVRPNLRGHGIGKSLLAYLAAKAVKEGCGRLDWWVLDWNQSSVDFYESLGARSMDEWTTYRLAGNALKRLAESKS